MYQTLILDQSGPHRITGWKEAVTDMFTGNLWIVKDYPEVLAVLGREALKDFPELRESIRQVLSVDAEAVTIRVPAVAILRRPVPRKKKAVKFSKVNVCTRDGFSCQYCGDRLPMRRLEFEHVVPRAQGGRTGWSNIVMACTDCNSEKRDRLRSRPACRSSTEGGTSVGRTSFRSWDLCSIRPRSPRNGRSS